MAEPTIAQKAPYKVELEPKSYYWCVCGESKKQPAASGVLPDLSMALCGLRRVTPGWRHCQSAVGVVDSRAKKPRFLTDGRRDRLHPDSV